MIINKLRSVKKGTRLTNQRLKILEFLQNVKTHPSAEEVYKNVQKDLPAISLGTVYRNLHILEHEGQIIKLEINNEAHYDGKNDNHQHAICSRCGIVYDIYNDKLLKGVLDNFSLKDFSVNNVSIIYKGICEKCK